MYVHTHTRLLYTPLSVSVSLSPSISWSAAAHRASKLFPLVLNSGGKSNRLTKIWSHTHTYKHTTNDFGNLNLFFCFVPTYLLCEIIVSLSFNFTFFLLSHRFRTPSSLPSPRYHRHCPGLRRRWWRQRPPTGTPPPPHHPRQR